MSTAATETPPSHPAPVISQDNLLFDYPEADVILRSRDLYEFRVLKIYIVHSSPTLGEKVLISPTPQPEPPSSTIPAESDVDSKPAANAPPVVQLPIDGAILFSLLTYIFPVPPVLPSTVEHVMELLSVAQMYKMDVVLTHIRNHIAQQEPPFIRDETAFLVYSLSRRHGLHTEVLQAARCTLSFASLTIEDLAEEGKLDMMPGALLHGLWEYLQSVRSNLTSDINEFKKSNALTLLGDSSCESLTDSGLPTWLDNYISSFGIARVPASLDISDLYSRLVEHIERQVLNSGCASCSGMLGKKIRAIWAALTAVVHGGIAKVRAIYVAGSPNGPDQFYRLNRIFPSLLRIQALIVEPDRFSYSVFHRCLRVHQSIQICPMRMSSSSPPTSSISVSIDRHWLHPRPFFETCSLSLNPQTMQRRMDFPLCICPRMRRSWIVLFQYCTPYLPKFRTTVRRS